MKQHVTKEQIGELSYEAKEKLYLALFPDMMEDENRKIVGFRKVIDINPAYLTIGRMIELLANGSQSYYLPGCSIGESEIDPENWCDELWTVVKEKLYDTTAN